MLYGYVRDHRLVSESSVDGNGRSEWQSLYHSSGECSTDCVIAPLCLKFCSQFGQFLVKIGSRGIQHILCSYFFLKLFDLFILSDNADYIHSIVGKVSGHHLSQLRSSSSVNDGFLVIFLEFFQHEVDCQGIDKAHTSLDTACPLLENNAAVFGDNRILGVTSERPIASCKGNIFTD